MGANPTRRSLQPEAIGAVMEIPRQLAASPMWVFLSGLNCRTRWRLSACSVAMRANSTGPPCSAANVNSSAAVATEGMS